MDPIISRPDVVIVHTLPGDCHRVLEVERLARSEGSKLIACTTWEGLSAPPELVDRLYERFDQVWVPSQVNATAFRRPGLHARVVPHCFDPRAPMAQVQRPDDDAFRFYWIGAWNARKNPMGLIRAFALAFEAGSRAELLIHSPGCSMDTFVHALASTGLEQRDLPTIKLSNKQLSTIAVENLHASSDCFVSASRGEAWNLPAFEALIADRMVITQYGLGSDDFLIDTSADLVDGIEAPAQVDVSITRSDDGAVEMKRIGAQGLTARCLWLEPNLSSLAEAMRHVMSERKRDIKATYDVAERFGYAAVAEHALKLLEES